MNASTPKESGINIRAGTSNSLLHDLKPDHELDPATSVDFPGSNSKEHVKVLLLLGSLSLEFTNIANVLEFDLAFLVIVATFSA